MSLRIRENAVNDICFISFFFFSIIICSMFCGWRITLWYNTPLPYLGGGSNSHICWCYSTPDCRRRDRIKRTTTLTTVSDCRLATNKLSAVSRTKLGISLLAHADLGVGQGDNAPPTSSGRFHLALLECKKTFQQRGLCPGPHWGRVALPQGP